MKIGDSIGYGLNSIFIALRNYALILLLLLAINSQAQFSQIDLNTSATVDSTVNQFLGANQIIGATVGLIIDGKIVFLKGYGMQDLANQIPTSEFTMYRTGSIAKAFTGALTLQLWEDSLLDFFADVRDYVPEWPVKPQGTITPYRLLAHRSGINHYQNYDTTLMLNYEPAHLDFDAIAAFDIFKNADLLFTPGTTFGYSSFGINLLGAVIERAGGQPFEDLIRQRINRPFGLPYLQPEYAWKRPYPNETKGYHYFPPEPLTETGDDAGILHKVPSGGFICTAIDLSLFAIAMMENRLYKDSTLFNWASNPAHSGANFGLGIMNETTITKPYLWHGGGQQRTNSFFMYYPDDKNGVVICSNTFLDNFAIKDLGEILIDQLPSAIISGNDWTPIPDTMVESQLIYPAHLTTVPVIGDSLIWASIQHAFTYIYEYDTDPGFSNPITDTIAENSLFASTLQPGETYYWRVRGLNTFLYDTVVGGWSEVRIFNTLSPIGVTEFDQNFIDFYPNPSTGVINIHGLQSNDFLEIYNVFGQNVALDLINNQINLSEEPKGIYFIKVVSENWGQQIKKIILY